MISGGNLDSSTKMWGANKTGGWESWNEMRGGGDTLDFLGILLEENISLRKYFKYSYNKIAKDRLVI